MACGGSVAVGGIVVAVGSGRVELGVFVTAPGTVGVLKRGKLQLARKKSPIRIASQSLIRIPGLRNTIQGFHLSIDINSVALLDTG
jgi:hypothetical protein